MYHNLLLAMLYFDDVYPRSPKILQGFAKTVKKDRSRTSTLLPCIMSLPVFRAIPFWVWLWKYSH